jgi:hypothetical protein
MSILGTIMSSILGGQKQPPPHLSAMSAPEQAPAKAQPETPHAPVVAPTPETAKAPEPAHPAAHAGTQQPPAAAKPAQVDVAAVLDKLVEDGDEDLNWRMSIVDLMKLLKLDSSLAARKTLAKELNYTGNTKDSAAMNMWLHKQVMAKLAQNGGKLPADVKH